MVNNPIEAYANRLTRLLLWVLIGALTVMILTLVTLAV